MFDQPLAEASFRAGEPEGVAKEARVLMMLVLIPNIGTIGETMFGGTTMGADESVGRP